jgi:2-oxoglutarate ferredoxin oxidoreductase subunit gamma
MAKNEVRVSGLGGQGVIMAAHIIGKAASIFGDQNATMTQAFGPEARGSACSAQVVLNTDPILYPYVRRTDILVSMSQEAYEKFYPELGDQGVLLYEKDLVQPAELAGEQRAYGIPATRIAEELGRTIVTNIIMVGFFAAMAGAIDPKALRKSVEDSVPPGTEKLNLKAFDRGFEYGRNITEQGRTES